MIERIKSVLLRWLGGPVPAPVVQETKYLFPERVILETNPDMKRLLLLNELAKLDRRTVAKAAEIYVELCTLDMAEGARPRREGEAVAVIEVEKAGILAGRGLWLKATKLEEDIQDLKRRMNRKGDGYGRAS